MKRTVSTVAIALCLVMSSMISRAQVSDAGLWTSFSIEKKFTQKFALTFTEELRFNENISELGTIFSDIGTTYKFGADGNVRTSLNYRFINKRRTDDSYSNRHRYYIDVTLRKKFGSIIPMYRARFQSQFTDVISSEDGNEADFYFRNRLMLKYSPDKKYQPYLGVELYTRLRSDLFARSISDNVRLTAGVDYEFNERNVLGLGYLVDREFNKRNPERNYVITLGYSLSL